MSPCLPRGAGTSFCITVDKKEGITTGVSAFDRAATIRALAGPDTLPTDLVRPGHIFPLRYTPGGVISRGGPWPLPPLLSPCGLAASSCVVTGGAPWRAVHAVKPARLVALPSGHTEAGVDLAILAGLQPASAICEMVKPGGAGDMARRGDMVEFAARHHTPLVSIAQMQSYIRRHPESMEIGKLMHL